MDRNFERALKLVLQHEGGWSDHKSDPGGPTMKGITIGTFRRFIKPNATMVDLRKITDAQVAVIYRRQYWDAVLGAELPDGIDYAVFDFAVNSGPVRAVMALQAVVGTVLDGKVGPATIAAVRAKPHAELINELCARRMTFLEGLANWSFFGRGWSKRVKDVRAQAIALAGAGEKRPGTKASDVTTEVSRLRPKSRKPHTGLAVLAAIIISVLTGIIDYLGGQHG